MNIRMPLLVSLVLIAVMLAVSLWGFSVIPQHARIAMHWGLNGKADGFGSREFVLLALPAVAAAAASVLAAVPWLEPRRSHLKASRKLYVVNWIGTVAILAVLHVLIVASAAGHAVNIPLIAVMASSILIGVVGNFLGKSRSTFLMGVRLPWTLSSEYAWEKTNRLTGRLFVLSGIAGLVGATFGGPNMGAFTLVGGTVAAALMGTVASVFYWRHDPDRDTGTPLAD